MDARIKRQRLDDKGDESIAAIALEQTISSTEDLGAGVVTPRAHAGERSRYVIESEFARGGLGRILKAHDDRLDRPVAIKELLTSSAVLRERFAREVAITAQLQHPSIVPVYDAGGSSDGEPFYVMKLLTGSRTLKEVVAESRDLDARLALLPNLIAVADAIAYAHSQQIIHRDLKPSNVLVGAFGETVVIDWGLAKNLAQLDQPDELDGSPYRAASGELTSVGSVLGTPQYMAPEQARGERVDKRADVYALGALLYHALVGRAPYRAQDSSDVLELVLKQAPLPLGEAQPGVPADLRAIVAKAMARNPDDRYADAEALAADLRRFQTGQLVGAHLYSRRQLVARWLGRHRTPVVLSALFAMTLIVAGVVGLRQIVRERDRAQARSHELLLTQARSQLEQDPTAAVAWAKSYPLDGADWLAVQDLAADAESRGVARHVFRRAEIFLSGAAFSHDGRRLAIDEGGALRISDVASGRVLARIAHGGTSNRLVWTDDDRSLLVTNLVWSTSSSIELVDVEGGLVTRLAEIKRYVSAVDVHGSMALTGGSDGTLRLWDLSARTSRTILEAKTRISAAHFSSDGATIAAVAADGIVRIIDVATGALTSVPANANSVLFAGGDRTLVVSQKDGAIAAIDLATRRRHEIGRHESRVTAFTLSADGDWVATGTEDHMVHLWNLRDHSTRVLAGHAGAVFSLRFSPDGRQLASGGADMTVRVWQLDSGLVHVLSGHTASVQSLSYSQDGRFLLSTAEDRTSRVWDASALFTGTTLAGHIKRAIAVVYSADGQRLASMSDDHTVRVWSLANARSEAVHQLDETLTALAFSPDGARVAAAGDRSIVVWDARSGDERERYALLPGACVWMLRFSPDGHRLAASTDVGDIYLSTDGALQRLPGSGETIRAIAFSPDGRTLAGGGDDHQVSLWNLASGGAHGVVQRHGDNVTGIAFSPDGKRIIASSSDGNLRVTELGSGVERTLRGPGRLSRLAVSHDGRYAAAAAGTEGAVVVWSLASGERRTLVGHTAAVLAVEFSTDDRFLLSSGYDKSTRVWDVASGAAAKIVRSDGYVLASAFSPDGASYASVGEDRFVHVWQMPAAAAAKPSLIRDELERLTTAAVSGAPPILKTQ